MLNRIRQWTGIYGTGFHVESVLGLLLPLAVVLLFGVVGAIFVLIR